MNEKQKKLNRAVCERKGWRAEEVIRMEPPVLIPANVPTDEVVPVALRGSYRMKKGYKLVAPGCTYELITGGWVYTSEDLAWERAANYAGDLNLAWELVKDLESFDRKFIFGFYKECSAEEIASIICEVWIPWYDLNH